MLFLKKVKKTICFLVAMIIILCYFEIDSIADTSYVNNDILNFIDELSNIENERFGEWNEANIIESYEMCSDVDDEISVLYDVYQNEENIGYFIWYNNQNIVAEFSNGLSPYQKYINNNEINENKSEIIYYYTYGNYAISIDGEKIWIDESGNEYEYISQDSGISTYGVISGVTPKKQNGWNCIVTALANVLWYWGNNGYEYLNEDITFGNMQREIRDTFLSISDSGFRNNDVPEVLYTYIKSKNRNYSSTSDVFWSPTISKVINQIDNGKPCLVGFAVGSVYSDTVGHMTACFGYQYIGGAYQVVLADGHSTSLVYKTWTSYNDCVITINLSK